MEILTRTELVLYSAYALIAIAVFIFTRTVLKEQERGAALENLDENRDRKSSDFLIKSTRQIYLQYFLPMVRGKPLWGPLRNYYRKKLITSGLRDELTPDECIAFKLSLIIIFPIIGGILRAGNFLDLSFLTILLTSILGWFYVDLTIYSRIAKRRHEILKSMPFIVDLLALSTEAGLDFVGAIGKVVEKSAPSPLVDEFSQLLKEIRVGASRQQALKEMSGRIDLQEVNSFVAILVSADQMGASIGKILRQQSEQIRVTRMLRAEKAGALAVQKVILCTFLFLVPAVLIMILSPFLISFIYPPGGN